MQWTQGPRASSFMEEMQKRLQQQYYCTLLDEEFNVSHTASVIAVVCKGTSREQAGTEPEISQCEGNLLALPTPRTPSELLSGWLRSWKENKSQPHKVSGVSQASATQVSALGWHSLITRLWFCKPLKALQHSKGRSSIPRAANPPVWRGCLLLELAWR